MFLSKSGTYEPCGIFNFKHLILALATIMGLIIAVKNTKVNKKQDIKKIIRILTCIVWVLEILKIVYNIVTGQAKNLNKVVPLYYCSLLLYAGLLSSIGKGKIERLGNVFLATGAILGGTVFIIFPTTSLPEYPMFHFISINSFFFHGTMIYLGIIINKFKYIELKTSDLKYYATMIIAVCIPAYIVNSIYGSNLMFISQDFPGTPVSILYHYTGKLFTPIMILIQMVVPYFIVYSILNLINCNNKFKETTNKCLQN